MVMCQHCKKDQPATRDNSCGFICCTVCGRVLYQDLYTEEPTFVKGLGGENRLSGVNVNSIAEGLSELHRRTLQTGKKHIYHLAQQLEISTEDVTTNKATNFYQLAVERSFTRGRRTPQVAAACLYIACRIEKKPFLLIDFSSCLLINVYVLGAVFLQLCKLLSLEEHAVVQKPVDPSLFIHVFTSRLMGHNNFKVSKTALSILASMKRDWMQTGRKPSGLCGAAVYIAALSHGFRYSKSDIVRVVHTCEATLTKRLIEFENTESGSLTIEEFNKNAEKLQQENYSCKPSDINRQKPGTMEMLCNHKDQEPHFAHGLCRACYADFVKISGGLNGGSDPPAFQHAERERLAKASAEVVKESSFILKPHHDRNSSENEVFSCAQGGQSVTEDGRADFAVSLCTSVSHQSMTNGAGATFEKSKGSSTVADETDNLSDIDDVEVNSYLNNEEETRYKKIIWDEMNKEYIQEQAAKEAAAAAAFKDVSGSSGDMRAAKELAAAVAKSRERRRQNKALEAKNFSPAQTAAEATRHMLTKKRLSSKINYDALEKLFDYSVAPDAKRNHVDSYHNSNATLHELGDEQNLADNMSNNDEREQDDEDMQETVAKGAYTQEWHFENGKEVYNDDYYDGDGDGDGVGVDDF